MKGCAKGCLVTVTAINYDKMTAGSISVPQIIPLRLPQGFRKHIIDSCTDIELRSGKQQARNKLVAIPSFRFYSIHRQQELCDFLHFKWQ